MIAKDLKILAAYASQMVAMKLWALPVQIAQALSQMDQTIFPEYLIVVSGIQFLVVAGELKTLQMGNK